MAQIDTVVFDAAGVIFAPSWNLSALRADGSECSHEAIVTAFQSAYHLGVHPMSDWERGRLDFNGFRVAMAAADESTDIDWSSLQMRIDPPTLFDSTLQFMTNLHDAGYRVGVITNTMHEFTASNLLKTELQEVARVWVRSCDVGYRKPEPKIFDLTLAQLQAVPERTLFLDDSPVCVEGATRFGMSAILVDDVDRTMAQARTAVGL